MTESHLEGDLPAVRGLVINTLGPQAWNLAESCLSVIAALLLKELSNPPALILVGPPSSEKTTVLGLLETEGVTYKSDNFTPASFVSHAANVPEKKRAEIDLLPRIKGKCLIVPELAPIFGRRQEDLLENISILTRVLDGQGLQTDTGVCGRRGYSGDYPLAFLGASTPIDHKLWKILGKLGSRLLFISTENNSSHSEQLARLSERANDKTPYKSKIKVCGKAVSGLLQTLWKKTGGTGSVSWNVISDNPKLKEAIARVAQFVARVRSTVSVWKDADVEYSYSQPTIEEPDRLLSMLYNLARGHALVEGRRQINESDLELVIKVALSSMPDDRRKVVELILMQPDDTVKESETGSVASREVEKYLRVSRPTAIWIMRVLSILDVAELDDVDGNISTKLTVRPEFEWFLSEDFRRLRYGTEGVPF